MSCLNKILLLSYLALVASCSSEDSVETTPPKQLSDAAVAIGEQDGYPLFSESHLQSGRDIWMTSCRLCHERGLASAPIVKDYQTWKPIIAKGKQALYENSINGFFGTNSMMPARGGNEELTDDEVKSAVDYMVATAILYKERN